MDMYISIYREKFNCKDTIAINYKLYRSFVNIYQLLFHDNGTVLKEKCLPRIDKSIVQTKDWFWNFIVLSEFITMDIPFLVECRIDSESVHARNEFDSNFDQN